jgi:crossover junction endodeoxyribonuclease RusA
MEPASGMTPIINDPSAIELRLPWAPSVNAMWRSVAGRTVLSATGRAFFASAAPLVAAQRAGRRILGRVACEIVLHAPTRTLVDIDNRAKATLDAITKGGLWDDDSQVDVLVVQRGTAVKSGAVVVRISEIQA